MNKNALERLAKLIRDSNKILLQAHRKPDIDSISSVLAWKELLESKGKKVTIICPTIIQNDILHLFPEASIVDTKIDFKSYDFSNYDLFLINDTSNSMQLCGKPDYVGPKINTFIIDHHITNNFNSENIIVEPSYVANTELLFEMFSKLSFVISARIATYLLAGMITTDTLYMTQLGLTAEYFSRISSLIKLGANFDSIIQSTLYSNTQEKLRLLGKLLNMIEVVSIGKNYYVCLIVSKEFAESNPNLESAKEEFTERYLATLQGSLFGIIAEEKEKNFYSLSIRSHTDSFNAADLATKLNGGGHKFRAGARWIGDAKTLTEEITKILNQ